MSKYELILFDLDGTLTDPKVGITSSVAYALEKFDIHIKDKSVLNKFIGPPLMEAFMEFYDFSTEQAQQAVTLYREYFAKRGIFENLVYEGIETLLKDLRAAGKRLCIATSKPEPFAIKISEHFGLTEFFEYIAGATLDQTRTKKEQVIEYALKQCDFTDRSKAIMIGDRKQDILGAHKCSIDSLGVLYGYGSLSELKNAGASLIAKNVEDIKKIILRESIL